MCINVYYCKRQHLTPRRRDFFLEESIFTIQYSTLYDKMQRFGQGWEERHTFMYNVEAAWGVVLHLYIV